MSNKGVIDMENKTCPSYEGGDCDTYPTPYSVKCADVINGCKWKNTNFNEISYEDYIKSEVKNDKRKTGKRTEYRK